MAHDTPVRHVSCPACKGLDVRRSWPKGLWDKIMAAAHKTPLRCRRCGCRFHRRLTPDERLGLPDLSEERGAVL